MKICGNMSSTSKIDIFSSDLIKDMIVNKKGEKQETVDIALQMPRVSGELGIVQNVLEGLNMKYGKIVGTNGFVVETNNVAFEGAIAQLLLDDKRFIFLIDFKETFSSDSIGSVAEFIARANSGMIIGNFEMDFRDGTLRFKSSFDYSGIKCGPAIVRNAILAALNNAGTYAPGFTELLSGVKTPAQAIADAET